MTQDGITISVVICAYTEDRWFDLVAAIDAVRTQSAPAHEIIVVIDHNEAMLERVRTVCTDVIAIANTEPQGLSGARNTGVAAATGAIIAFLDDDAMPIQDWLARLGSAYMSPAVISVGGAIVPFWLTPRPGWLPEEFDWVVGCTYRGMPETTTPVRNLIGANISFRREVFDEVGGFLNGIGRIGKRPLGCEETELCIRIQRRWPDKVVLYYPDAKVHHRVRAARATWQYFRARCYAEGLSKAMISSLIGGQQGLSSERNYTLRTLPQGVVRSMREVFTQRDLAGFGRAGAIVAGLAVTITGYGVGIVEQRVNKMLGRRQFSHGQFHSTTSTS